MGLLPLHIKVPLTRLSKRYVSHPAVYSEGDSGQKTLLATYTMVFKNNPLVGYLERYGYLC